MYTWATLKRTIREFREDNLTDWAAALTYYAVLAIFPGLIVLVAILGLVGQHPETTNALLEIVDDVGPESAVETFRGPIESVVKSNSGAGALLGVGPARRDLVGVRIHRRVHPRDERDLRGRGGPPVLEAAAAADRHHAWRWCCCSRSSRSRSSSPGRSPRSIGDAIGLGDTAVTVWNIAKWPVIVVIVMGMFAVLYYVAPNVRQPRLRWITPGGVLAVLGWLVVSVGFGVYVANFGSYDKTYGSLGGVIIFLVWLWLSNLALLFGAEFDAELERSRELAAGLPAEDSILLPERSPAKE